MKQIYTLVVFVLALTGMAVPAHADCLTLANNAKKFKLVATFDNDIRKVFRKAGICAKYMDIPLKRIQHNMQDGKLDGEYLRVKSYINLMKDYVIPIPTEAINLDGYLVSLKSAGFAPTSLTELENRKVGVVHGAVWQIKAAKKAEHIYKAYKYDILAKLLKRKEIDAFLIERLSLRSLLMSGLFSPGDVTVSPVVVRIPTYILLHKKHKGLIAKLDDALKQVKKEGGFKFSALPE